MVLFLNQYKGKNERYRVCLKLQGIFYLILYNTCAGYVTLQIGCEHGIGINRFRLVFNDIGIDGAHSTNAYPIYVGQVDIIF